MQNRRQHYRHSFPLKHRPAATIIQQDGATDQIGEIVNLSIGGICVKFDDAPVLSNGKCLVHFVVEGSDEPIKIRAQNVHFQAEVDRCIGFEFLFPAHAPMRESVERKISKYLLDVQRYERQLLKEAKKFE